MLERMACRTAASIVVAAVIAALAGLNGGAYAQGSTLVWARYGDIDTLDPHRATSTLSMQVWDQIYNTLLAFDDNVRVKPNLAESWTVSPNGLEYTFKLHQGVTCHDGSPFTAADVKYTADRAFDPKAPSVTKTAWGPIKSVTVVDPLTVKFTLERPFAAFLSFLTDSFSSMLCRSNTAAGAAFGSTTAIGTGPWKLVRWVKNDTVELVRNRAYRNFGKPLSNTGAPYLDRLIIKTIPEAETRLAALRTGEVQIAEPPLDEIPAIKKEGKLKLLAAANTGQDVFFEFAVSRPPFNDVRARKAIAYATDPQAAINIVYPELNLREWCPIARGVFGNDQDFCRKYGYEYNPSKAKALLAELGYGLQNPLNVVMIGWTGGNRERILEIFQSQLAQIGVNVKIEMLDIGSFNARVRQENEKTTGIGELDTMTWSWYDPDILYQLWHSPGAYHGFHTLELDAMLEKTRTVTDPAARMKAVHDVIQYLMENAVEIGLYTPGWEWIFAERPEVEGFKVLPFLHPMFNDVKFSK